MLVSRPVETVFAVSVSVLVSGMSVLVSASAFGAVGFGLGLGLGRPGLDNITDFIMHAATRKRTVTAAYFYRKMLTFDRN
jgi:hypothetical protein